MVQINFAQKTVNVKIVYYGPGMSGKTTNLEVVHQRAPDSNRGDLTSISTDGDRTLFFDYMPLDLGTVAGMRTCFQVYTVPGQVYYNSTRKLVLQGVDGVIFVADSSPSMRDQNLESLRNLEENLNEYGKSLATMPHVLQWNKRDLPDAVTVEEMEKTLNTHGAPTFEGIANTGQGVFPTLKGLAQLVLKSIMQEAGESPAASSPRANVPKMPASQPAPAPAPAAAGFGAPAPAPAMQTPPNLYPDPAQVAAQQQHQVGAAGGHAQAGGGHHAGRAPHGHSQPMHGGHGGQGGHGGRMAPAPSHRPQTAGDVMRQPQSAARPPRRPAAGSAKRARPQGAPGRPAVAPKKKRSAFATGMFVLFAAVLGAGLAVAALHFLK